MIELSAEWLTEVARRAADDEDAWCAAHPTWLALDDEPSAAVVGRSTSAAESDKRLSPLQRRTELQVYRRQDHFTRRFVSGATAGRAA